MENQWQAHLVKHINNYVYNTESVIGKGFSSIVYKGQNSHTNQIVAIKVMDVRSAKTDIEKMLLSNEIKALSTVSHNNVINCYEICHTVNNIYIIMEFCEQGNLSEFIKTHGKLREEQALAILYYLTQGLHHIHSMGFLHRDIKSTNIIIHNGIPKIADFGFAIPATDAYSKSLYNVGSPLYMSPQAYKKSQYSFGSDTWGLGVIFYQMLIGSAPFKGIDYDTMVNRVFSGDMFQSLNLSPLAKSLLDQMVCVDVRQRIPTSQILTILETNKPKSNLITNPRYAEKSSRSPLLTKNSPHLQQRNMSKQNSPIKMLQKASKNSSVKLEYSPQFEQRLMLNRLLDSLCIFLLRSCETQQLLPLILRHWKFNINKLVQLNQHCTEVNESQRRMAKCLDASEQLLNEPYFRHVINKVLPESQTFCDYTLFWLRVSLRHNEPLLEHLLTAEKLDEQLEVEYVGFMKTVRYCQVLDHIRNGDGHAIFPPNEVLDWLIKDSKNITSEGVEYLNAILNVLINSE